MDVAIAIDALVPGAKYGGSVTANTQESYAAIRWEDTRVKPTWEDLVAFYNEPEVVVVPPKVTMRQARLALLGAGLLDQVETLLASLEGPEGQAARIEWDYSSEVHRHKPFVQSLGSQLGLDDEQLDDLFIAASQID